MAQPMAAGTTGKALARWAPPILSSSSSSSSASNESPAAALMTTSSCTTETAEGVHVFNVHQYRLIKDLVIGKTVRSGAFAVGGYRWAVLFYPSGSDPSKTGVRHVSVYLELLTPKVDEVRVMFDLSLVDSAGKKRKSFFKHGDGLRHAVFSTKTPPLPLPLHHPPRCWGEADFARGDLVPYIVGSGLVIQCDITVIKPPRVTQTRRLLQPIAMPPPGIGKDRHRGSCDKLEMACLKLYTARATHPPSQRLKRSPPAGEADDDSDLEATAHKRLKRA